MTSWADVSVLVTGASGFLGRRLCARLHNLGAHVTAVVRRPEAVVRLAEVPRITIADVTDAERIREVFEETRPVHVYHLAALTAASQGLQDLSRYVHQNTEGTAAILAAAAHTKPLKVVVTTSAQECGKEPGVPFSDDVELRPRTPYGISKALATRLCLDVSRIEKLPVTVARFFLIYGPGMSARFFLQQLLDATLAGRTLEMTEGRQARDFLHVDDAVDGLIAASTSPALDGRVVNVCTGVEHSLQDVCLLWEKITGRTGVARRGTIPYRPHENFHYVGDPGRLREATAWSPRISLEVGLRALWDDARRGGDATSRNGR